LPTKSASAAASFDRLELLEADQAAGDRDERLVDVSPALIAEPKPPVLMEPGERALNDPALATEARAVRASLSGDDGFDVMRAKPRFCGPGLIAAVAEQRGGSPFGTTTLSANRRDRLDQREQLGDVVAVGGSQQACQRNPA
jgi:hypothetical protein